MCSCTGLQLACSCNALLSPSIGSLPGSFCPWQLEAPKTVCKRIGTGTVAGKLLAPWVCHGVDTMHSSPSRVCVVGGSQAE
jgi:hypothetical protein